MKDFFVDSKPYEWPHIVVLLVVLIVGATLIFLTKRYAKSEKSQVLVIKITAGVTLLLTILSRFIYNDFKLTFIDFLPSSFCSTMGFVLPLFILFCKKDSKSLYFALFAGMMGGLITILSGDDIGQLKVQNTLISYAYHSLMVIVPILCFATKYSRPTLEKVPRFITGLCALVTYGIFTNQVFNFSNNMFLNSPLIDGITWWLCGLVMIAVAVIVALVYEAFTRKWKEQNLYLIYANIKNKLINRKN